MADTKLQDFLHQDTDPGLIPGKYADDATFGFILLSGAAFFASILSVTLDQSMDGAVYFVLMATYFALLYVALDKR